jgi:hypothetical protein
MSNSPKYCVLSSRGVLSSRTNFIVFQSILPLSVHTFFLNRFSVYLSWLSMAFSLRDPQELLEEVIFCASEPRFQRNASRSQQ